MATRNPIDATIRRWRFPVLAGLTAISLLLLVSSVSAASEGRSSSYIVVFKNSVENPGKVADGQVEYRGGKLGFVYRHAIEGYSATLTKKAVDAIRQNPKVAYVTVDPPVELFEEEEEDETQAEDNGGSELSEYSIPTGIKRAFGTSNAGLDVDGVDDLRVNADVAVIDTGVDEHPDLNLVARTDCTDKSHSQSCVDGHGRDDKGHATHVSGTVGALDNGFGVVGVAPGARIWSVKVLTNGAGSTSNVIAGIDWVTAHADQIEVANMSLGGAHPEIAAERQAIEESVNSGVVYAVAAGNSNQDAQEFAPASDPDVITVSALADYDGMPGGAASPTCKSSNGQTMGADDTRASFSNYGSTIEVAAPGTCILSTVPGGYGLKSGTSMATPHVAGAAAILASMSNPASRADVEAIRNKIIETGNFNWTDDSGDGVKEPLLDVEDSSVFGGGKAPTITREVATGVSSTSATLNGKIDPNGLATTYQFEYGPTESYGTKAPTTPESIGSGASEVKVSKPITGLTSKTEYHFRLVASSSAGTTYGPDQTIGALLRWHACTKQSGGKYSSSTCAAEGAPNEWEALPFKAAEKTTIVTKGNPIVFTSTQSGVLTTFSCETEVTTPSLENLTSGIGVGNAQIKYKGCKAEGTAGEEGCKVTSTASYPSKLELAMIEGKPRVVLTPSEGTTFATFSFSECKIEALNGSWSLTGSAKGAYSNTASQIEFNSETTAEGLLLRSTKATAVGTIGIETTGGGRVRAEAAHPIAITQPATNIKSTEATLEGTVNPEGIDTHYRFEWGKTIAYGNNIPVEAKDVGSGTSSVAVNEQLSPGLPYLTSNLVSGTTYHFRLVTVSSAGTAYGIDRTFTTTAAPIHWYGCAKHGSGKYASAKCQTEGEPYEWESLPLKEAEKASITAKVAPITFAATISGLKGSFSCETEVSAASLENPTGGGNGRGNAEIKYKGCKTVENWAGCTITPGAVVPSKLELATIEGKPAIVLTPSEGTTLASFSFAGCETQTLNGSWSLTGTAKGAYSNTASQIEFNSETTAEGLELRGAKATAVGALGVETSGGGRVRAEATHPIAITKPATNIKLTEATLEGTVNPEGIDTHYQFEYGKTIAYGQSVPVEAKDAGEGIADVKVAEAISGLVTGTLYHYRLTATNGVSSGYGVDMTFTAGTVPLHWFACTKQTGGRYNSKACSAEGASKEWESVRLKEAEKVSVTAKGNPITFAATIGGLKGSFSCETEVSAASLENPTGGGAGGGSAEIKYKGCKTVENWTNCTITPGAVVPSKLELVTFEGKPQARLSAKEGTVFANFSFSGCNSGVLNGTRNLYGTLRGLYSNANSKIEFSTESSAEGLRFNNATEGPLATAVGSIGLEASGGGSVAAVNSPIATTEAASGLKPTVSQAGFDGDLEARIPPGGREPIKPCHDRGSTQKSCWSAAPGWSSTPGVPSPT